jgi:ribonuclease P protein component
MLSKRSRLTALEVREILKGGRSARLGTLSVKYIYNAGARAAVVVSSKVAKTAVLRNKLRRDAYRVLREALPKNTNAVFFLHSPALDSEELKTLCLKLS